MSGSDAAHQYLAAHVPQWQQAAGAYVRQDMPIFGNYGVVCMGVLWERVGLFFELHSILI